MLKINSEPEIIEEKDLSFIDDFTEIWEVAGSEFGNKVNELSLYEGYFKCNIGIKTKENKYIIERINFAHKEDVEDFLQFLYNLKTEFYIDGVVGPIFCENIITYYCIDEKSDKLYIAGYEKYDETSPDEGLKFYIRVPFESFIKSIDKQIKYIEKEIQLYKNREEISS